MKRQKKQAHDSEHLIVTTIPVKIVSVTKMEKFTNCEVYKSLNLNYDAIHYRVEEYDILADYEKYMLRGGR